MHELVRAFSARTQRCKEHISQPPTPSPTSSSDGKSALSDAEEGPSEQQRTHRLGSFLPTAPTTSDVTTDRTPPRYLTLGSCRVRLPRCCMRLPRLSHTMESYSMVYVSWLFVVMMAYTYNSTVIFLRGVFPYQTEDNWRYWLVADYLSDFVYLVDIIVFKSRLRFTQEGVVETEYSQTRKHYVNKLIFKLDMLSLLPLDIFYLTSDQPWQRQYVWLRLPRMLKIQTFWEFYARCDQAAKSSAHVIRIVKTMTYMLYLIHIETCGYYAVSDYEGLNSTTWVYNNQGNAYIRCFYLATKTSTSIGNNPKPTNNLEFLFMTLYWLSGVFVFALLIGQIRDIVEAAGQVKTSYRKKMDDVLHYMQTIQISDYTQDRTRQWFLYNWEQSKTIDERSLVAALPKKLQTDLAISVHFNTLIKVQLFQDCERNLLYDLVLKLKPNLFLPGDYVCQKGEVGKEMYIVSQGQVEVVGGEKKDVVLATLSEGSVFGEISLLAMSGRGNRRTADVRSSGFTSVFTLSKNDFEEAMNEYPEAQKLLKKRAKKLLKENARAMEKSTAKVEAEEIIKTPHDTPKMVRTVIQVLNPKSQMAQKLNLSKKYPSTPSGARHLAVLEPGPKTLMVPGEHGMGHSNLAFDLSDEQLQNKPSIITQSYDDNDFLMDNDDEIIVIERTEHTLPQSSNIDKDVEAILNDDDDDNDDSDGTFQEQFMDIDPFVEDDESFEQEFFNSVMAELRAQDVIDDHNQPSQAETSGNAALQNRATSSHIEKSAPLTGNYDPGRKTSAGTEVFNSMMAEYDNMAAAARDEINAPQSENIGPRDENSSKANDSEHSGKTREGKTKEQTTEGRREGGNRHKRLEKQGTQSDNKRSSTRQSTTSRHHQESKAKEEDGGGAERRREDGGGGGEGRRREGEEGGEVSTTAAAPQVHMVTVGIGGVSAQELSPLSSDGRRRKVSTVTQPRLSPNSTHSPTPAPHYPQQNPLLTPIEDCGGKGNNLPLGTLVGAPPTGHVTSALDLHHQENVPLTPAAAIAASATSAHGNRPHMEAALSSSSSSSSTMTTTEMTTTAEICMSARPSATAVATSESVPESAASPLTPDLSNVGESAV
ncbi:hypothetical protein ACOMHN_006361 [Nucella lapillus]